MHGLFPQSLLFSYSIPTWLLILKLLIDFFFLVFVLICLFFFFCSTFHFIYFCFDYVCLFGFFYPCRVFVFAFFFRHLSFHQRRPSTSVSNSIESFCVPRGWTANFSRRSSRHRTHGERLLRSVHSIYQIFLL